MSSSAGATQSPVTASAVDLPAPLGRGCTVPVPTRRPCGCSDARASRRCVQAELRRSVPSLHPGWPSGLAPNRGRRRGRSRCGTCAIPATGEALGACTAAPAATRSAPRPAVRASRHGVHAAHVPAPDSARRATPRPPGQPSRRPLRPRGCGGRQSAPAAGAARRRDHRRAARHGGRRGHHAAAGRKCRSRHSRQLTQHGPDTHGPDTHGPDAHGPRDCRNTEHSPLVTVPPPCDKRGGHSNKGEAAQQRDQPPQRHANDHAGLARPTSRRNGRTRPAPSGRVRLRVRPRRSVSTPSHRRRAGVHGGTGRSGLPLVRGGLEPARLGTAGLPGRPGGAVLGVHAVPPPSARSNLTGNRRREQVGPPGLMGVS